jgi:hypothetical protein
MTCIFSEKVEDRRQKIEGKKYILPPVRGFKALKFIDEN